MSEVICPSARHTHKAQGNRHDYWLLDGKFNFSAN